MCKHTSCAITVDLPIDKNINADKKRVHTHTYTQRHLAGKVLLTDRKGKGKIWRLINIDYFLNVEITGSE
jgi:hypothetical protein